MTCGNTVSGIWRKSSWSGTDQNINCVEVAGVVVKKPLRRGNE